MEHYTNFCDACGERFTSNPSSSACYNGLSFNISGGYNQFNDYIGDDAPMLTLCHSCVLQMIALFPAMGKKLGKACHPCGDTTPCCAFAWTQRDDVCVVPSADLQSWVPCYP